MATGDRKIHVGGAVSFGMPPHDVPQWQDLNSKVIPHHGMRWRNIASELGLVPSVLDTIAESCADKTSQECLTAVLVRWLQQDGPNATWKKLEHAITNARRAELGLDPLTMELSSAPPPPPYTATIDPYSKMIQSVLKILHTPSDSVIEGELQCLIKAAEEGDISKLQYFIQELKYHVDTRDPRDRPYKNGTLLFISCYNNANITAVEKLLELGADVNAVNKDGWTALHAAAKNNNEDVVNMLLMKDPTLTEKSTESGGTVLHVAATHNSVDVFNVLLKNDPTLIKRTTKDGYSALHYAASQNCVDFINMLLMSDPTLIEMTSKDGCTALLSATIRNSVDVFNVLLTKDPTLIEKTTTTGMTVLHGAAFHKSVDVVNILLMKDSSLISQTDKFGNTPLHDAAGANTANVDIVYMLLAKDPTLIKQTNNEGLTPLDKAVKGDNGAAVWTMVHHHNVDITQCCQPELKEKLHKLLANEERTRRKPQNPPPYASPQYASSPQYVPRRTAQSSQVTNHSSNEQRRYQQSRPTTASNSHTSTKSVTDHRRQARRPDNAPADSQSSSRCLLM